MLVWAGIADPCKTEGESCRSGMCSMAYIVGITLGLVGGWVFVAESGRVDGDEDGLVVVGY